LRAEVMALERLRLSGTFPSVPRLYDVRTAASCCVSIASPY
jgi:hypothetical protein